MAHRRLIVLLTSLAPLLQASAKQKAFRSTMSLTYPTPMIFGPPSGVHKSTLIFLHGAAHWDPLLRLMQFTSEDMRYLLQFCLAGMKKVDEQPAELELTPAPSWGRHG